MFIAAQDADTIALNNALASSPSNADSVFESENDNVSKFVYDFVRPQSQATTTTTLPGSSTPNTPSSKDSITTNKSGSSKNTVTVKNGINDSTSSSTSKVSTGEDTSAYESLPELQTFLNETDNAVKASVKKSAMAKFKSGHDSPFEMYWLAGGLMASFIAIGARQAIIVRKATKKLKS